MKRFLPIQKGALVLLLALFAGLGTAYAYSFSAVCSTGQTLYYNITDATNHFVEITYPGTSSSSPWEGYTVPEGNISLPSSVSYNGTTYAVKGISEKAFDHCNLLTGELVIPSTVGSIGDDAFGNCSHLSGLTLPNSVNTIGSFAFYGCGFTGSLTIPSSVTEMGKQAFSDCSGITQVNYNSVYCNDLPDSFVPFYGVQGPLIIGQGVQRIPANIFTWTHFTGTLNIPNSVTSIGTNAFKGCTGFTGTLTLSNNLTTIGEGAFYGCTGLTGSLTLPSTLTTIGPYAFYDCAGLTGSLIIPNAVTEIGEYAFRDCTGFTGTLTLPSSLTSISNYAFYGCGFTGALVIPNGVTTIGNSTFIFCSGLSSLTLPASVTSLGPYAFFGCQGLTMITAHPTTPPTLGEYAFHNVPNSIPVYVPCSALEDYQAASGWSAFTNYQCLGYDFSAVCSTGQRLYYNITDATNHYVEITYPGTSSSSPWNGFTKPTGNITLPPTVTYNGVTYTVKAIGNHAFDHCSGLTGSLTIPNTVTSIGNFAFYYCNGFTGSLTLLSSLTTIGNYAFYCCTGFTGSLTIPNSVTSIGSNAFYYLNGLTGSLTIGNSVNTIGDSAFQFCRNLSGSLTIGSSVTAIGERAFQECYNVTSMTVLPETPPTLGNSVFYDVPTDIPVEVPCASLEDYQAAEGWSAFTNLQCREVLTVYDGTATNFQIPAYITYFDDFTRSQFVIPAADLAEMTGRPILSMTFYTTSSNVPYTTLSDADVYLMEVDYTSISAYEPKESATTVYSGRFSIVSADDGGGMMTIYFSTHYVYQGGNLLVGIENVEDNGFKYIVFVGQTVSGASISGHYGSSTGTIPANQQNFIPKTSFGYAPSMCAPKTLPYTCGFEEEDEFDCWTMLNCHPSTGRYSSSSYPTHQGDYGFCFYYHTHYNTHPPQYLISPELEGTTGVDVSFYYKNAVSLWLETFQVGYSTTTMLPDAFTWGDELTAQNNIWTYYENYFPEGTKYVAVKFNSIKFSSYGQLSLVLDDFSFIPAFCPLEDQCELTFTLTDSYGDGWNGASINVVDVETGIVLATMTNVTHDHANAPITETYTLTVCDGRELRFEWVSGNWDSECSYVVTTANGTEIFSGSGAMSEPVTYSVSCSLGQTIALTAGWNWFSLYVEAEDPVGMLQMLEESLGENGLMIKSTDIYTENDAEWGWFGDLDEEGIVNEQMYKILVSGPCTVNLEGTPANPANHPITINKGWNWIGFPNAEAISLDDAFDGFAQEGDLIRNSDGETPYDPEWGGWFGDFETLEPGQGYMYYSANNTPRTLIFPSGAK